MRMLIVLTVVCAIAVVASAQTTRPNILLITADDMNYDTPGVAGCKVADITPNIDRLASEGIYFKQAHVTVAVCQPSRSAIMTGRYPHHNGAIGFNAIRDDVPTLGEQLRAAGYLNGIFAKVPHLAPIPRFCWDTIVPAEELGVGRDPKLYYQHAREFIEKARGAGKPFFLMANSQDPHRPFAGSDAEKQRVGVDEGDAPRRQRKSFAEVPKASRYYKPEEITVPPFLPDLPEVRKELAQYYTSAHRCDETVGEILRALKESGQEDNTLVMFLSDNGISEPFAKSNCYLTSTRTPWIVRWPGKVKPGQVDETHLISGIDFLPTVLEALGLAAVEGVDGRSFVPLLCGQEQGGRDEVVTVYHQTSGHRDYPMRCVQDKHIGYIYNGWSDGKTEYKAEPLGGLAFGAMKKAAATNPAIKQRVAMALYRAPEELYDFGSDPGALKNLADDAQHREQLETMRGKLRAWMRKNDDPLINTYEEYLNKH